MIQTHASLFSGIGGFDLAASWMNWENVFHCDKNPFCRIVLKHHFPKSISHGDITKTSFTQYRSKIDVLSGGFPCQPYSVAGNRGGTDDERDMWPENYRAIKEIRPRWFLGENVRGLVNWEKGVVFDKILADLEIAGYKSTSFLLPALSVDAPHERFRIWIVAYSPGFGMEGNRADRVEVSQVSREETISRRDGSGNNWKNWPTEPPFCRGDDGFSSRVDKGAFSRWWTESMKALGNAIVPQVAFEIFKAIEDYDKLEPKK